MENQQSEEKQSRVTSQHSDTVYKNNVIAERFILQASVAVGSYYKAYRGVDLNTKKFITVYLKPSSKQRHFSKIIKEQLKLKICPSVVWTGTEKIDKVSADVEVHMKLGPSLLEVMMSYRKKISEKTLYLLLYHLLKLIDRIDNAGFVHRNMTLGNIVLGDNFTKNELYFLNCFDIQRKNQDPLIACQTKYCSVGSHLKLKTSSKDTLESMCYLIMDFYLKGTLFGNNTSSERDYLQAKTCFKPEGLPVRFIEFFQYVKNLNYGEDVKFTQWKIKFKKMIPEEDFNKPYEWIINAKQKHESRSISQLSNPAMQANQVIKSMFLQGSDDELEQVDDSRELDECLQGEVFRIIDKVMYVQLKN